MSIVKILADAAEEKLRRHFAGEFAAQLAEEVAGHQAGAVIVELQSFLETAPDVKTPAPKEAPKRRGPGRPKKAVAAAAPAPAPTPARRGPRRALTAVEGGGAGGSKAKSRTFSAESLSIMSRKKKLHWAVKRVIAGRPLIEGDEEAIDRAKADGSYDAVYAREAAKASGGGKRAPKRSRNHVNGANGVGSTLSEKLAI